MNFGMNRQNIFDRACIEFYHIKTRQGKARQGKARQGKARQGKARQEKKRKDNHDKVHYIQGSLYSHADYKKS
jgi:predicted signal transduction protein with EAL and GGDEF domain